MTVCLCAGVVSRGKSLHQQEDAQWKLWGERGDPHQHRLLCWRQCPTESHYPGHQQVGGHCGHDVGVCYHKLQHLCSVENLSVEIIALDSQSSIRNLLTSYSRNVYSQTIKLNLVARWIHEMGVKYSMWKKGQVQHALSSCWLTNKLLLVWPLTESILPFFLFFKLCNK